MYDQFTNLFDDVDKKVENGNIVIEGDVNINIIEKTNFEKDEVKKDIKIGQKSVKKLRQSACMKNWKKKIRSRDEGECQCCHETVEEGLEVHHIMPLAKYPDLGCDENNGIALCKQCHSKYHQMYQGAENASTFAKFLRDYANRRYV